MKKGPMKLKKASPAKMKKGAAMKMKKGAAMKMKKASAMKMKKASAMKRPLTPKQRKLPKKLQEAILAAPTKMLKASAMKMMPKSAMKVVEMGPGTTTKKKTAMKMAKNKDRREPGVQPTKTLSKRKMNKQFKKLKKIVEKPKTPMKKDGGAGRKSAQFRGNRAKMKASGQDAGIAAMVARTKAKKAAAMKMKKGTAMKMGHKKK